MFENAKALVNISATLQAISQGIIQAVGDLAKLTPSSTTGQLSVNTVVLPGFVRVTGLSIIADAPSVGGGLYDTTTIAGAVAATQVYQLSSTFIGYVALQLVFVNGLVYKPGTNEKVCIFYTRT